MLHLKRSNFYKDTVKREREDQMDNKEIQEGKGTEKTDFFLCLETN